MRYRFRLFLSVALILGAGCFKASDTPAPSPHETGIVEKTELAIELRADTPVIQRNEIPRFTAYLVNRSTQPMTVVLPGDGSSDSLRTPVLRWNPPMLAGRSCGNINRLKADEVISLGSGERAKLDWLGCPYLATVGTHKIFLEMEHIPDLEWHGVPLGKHDAGAMAKIQNSRGFKAVSNVVEVEVRE
jgi:hypothetical protein